jgi:uncharacterized protein YdeI (YjbR/CyaY-like superfamily)
MVFPDRTSRTAIKNAKHFYMTKKPQEEKKPHFFAKGSDFRKWLEKNHEKEKELIVGFYKVNSGKPSMNWSQSVDEALCFGWIDSVRRSLDKDSYTIRFTPRRPGSIWSAINIRKVETLIEEGRMTKAGLKLFEQRDMNKSMIYSFENAALKLTAEYSKTFRANKKAWDFFKAQAPSYQKTIIYWIMSAKQEKTRLARLEKTIAGSEKGKKL